MEFKNEKIFSSKINLGVIFLFGNGNFLTFLINSKY